MKNNKPYTPKYPSEASQLFATIVGCYVMGFDVPESVYEKFSQTEEENTEIPDGFSTLYSMIHNMEYDFFSVPVEVFLSAVANHILKSLYIKSINIALKEKK